MTRPALRIFVQELLDNFQEIRGSRGLQLLEKLRQRAEPVASAAAGFAFMQIAGEGQDFDGVEPHQTHITKRRAEPQSVLELVLRPGRGAIETDVSSSSRTGTRGSIWNIFRNILSSRM